MAENSTADTGFSADKNAPGMRRAQKQPSRHTGLKVAGAVAGGCLVLVCGFALGSLWGQDLLERLAPGVFAPDTPQVITVTTPLEDGYGGTLARRAAAVAEDMAEHAAQQPSLQQATAGTLGGLAAATGPGARYLSQAELEQRTEEISSAASSVQYGLVQSTGTGVGLIRLQNLYTGVSDSVASAIDELDDLGAQAYMLDLRTVSDGTLGEVVQLASLFMSQGTVTNENSRTGSSRYEVQLGLQKTDAPLVLLVSVDTQGVGEILAAAFQDHQRALLVGENTAGTGAVLTQRTLSFGGAVLYVGSVCTTPDGYDLADNGLTPDSIVTMQTSLRSTSLSTASASPGVNSTEAADQTSSDGQAAGSSVNDAPASTGQAAQEESAGQTTQDSQTAQEGQAGQTAQSAAAAAAAAAEAQDTQMLEALRIARAWIEGGSIDVAGLSNAPGPL